MKTDACLSQEYITQAIDSLLMKNIKTDENKNKKTKQ